MTERVAVEIVATFDTARPDYQDAIDTALRRRGTRDAVMVLLTRDDAWDQVLATFPNLRSDDLAAAANIDVLIGIAHWIKGDSATADRILADHTRHLLADLARRCIGDDVSPVKWMAALERIDLDICFACDY